MTDRSVKVYLKGDISDFNRKMLEARGAAGAFTNSLDTSSDRMQNLVQTSLALGPALVPIGAAAVPAISGLTNQLGFAAIGAGVLALAFQGVGDALKATNDYALEPSAANFEKLQETLRTLGPEGRDFVTVLQKLRPEMQELRDLAQQGLFPGAEAGLTDLMHLLPQAEGLVSTVSTTLGDLLAEAGDNLDDPRWVEFFTFLQDEARPTMLDMGRTLGNFAEGFANLWMAFDPLSDDFSNSFLEMSRDFSQWTDELDQTQGFQDFLQYVSDNGPRAFDAMTSLANAGLQIVEAAAPVGSAVLPVISVLADTIATVADSDAGPVLIGAAAGISAISRAVALYNVANGSAMAGLFSKSALGGAARAAKDLPAATGAWLRFDAATARAGMTSDEFSAANGRMGNAVRGTAKLVGAGGGLAFALSGLDDKLGLTNTTTLGLAGSMAGPLGAAVGAGVGLTMDLAHANDDLWSAVARANTVLGHQGASLDEQNAAFDTARQKIFDLQDTLSGANGINLSSIFAADKNALEGLFGRSDLEEANSALADLEKQQQKNAEAAMAQQFAEAGMTAAMAGASKGTREQTAAILDLIAEHNALTDATLASADANIAYEQALDDAAKAGREGKNGLDANTQAGRDNLTLLTRLAGSWNNLSAEQQNAKGASDRARREFIAIAEQMGATRKRAKQLADEYLDIPTSVSTNVKSNAPKVTAEVRSLIKALKDIPGLTETTLRTIKETYIVPPKSKSDKTPSLKDMLDPNRKAHGGEILGPGGPRSDLIPLLASNKEIMVNAFDAQEHRDLLLGINAGLFRGKTPHMLANGGEVNGARVQRMAGAGRSGSSGTSVLSISLVGQRARLVGPDLIEFTDGRIEAAIAGQENFTAGQRRGKTK